MKSVDLHTDGELVALVTAGDVQAFEIIYRRYAPVLYGYARKNIRSNADCEEIIQDVFLSLWERRSHLAQIGVLRAYLFQMVKFKVIRYFQHEKVKQRYVEHFKLFSAVVSHANPESGELSQSINKALAGLPERCQMAVKLRLHENLSNDEIAARMQIKKTTVENYFVVAMRHLRRVLAVAG